MKKLIFLIIFITAVSFHIVDSNEPLPILFWHSAGESCCEKEFEAYSSILKKYLGDSAYIKSVQIGTSATSDKLLSLSMHPFEQIKIACDAIKNDTAFSNGFNGIGLSQGGLLMRGLVEVCDGPKMHNLISLGGPQQGVYQYPNCGKFGPAVCATLRFQLNRLIYTRPTQNLLTPTTYWHDITERRYLRGSTFLPIINNENEVNEKYRSNLKSLKKFVMVMYDKDSSIVPKESSIFGYYDSNKNIVPLESSALYQQDKLGLKSMNENGQLTFLTCPGVHLTLNEDWFSQNIVPFLKN